MEKIFDELKKSVLSFLAVKILHHFTRTWKSVPDQKDQRG